MNDLVEEADRLVDAAKRRRAVTRLAAEPG
jgi:hypothetical protein